MAKMMIIFDMAAAVSDAQAVRTIMTTNSIDTVIFWADGIPIGGSSPSLQANANINAIVFNI